MAHPKPGSAARWRVRQLLEGHGEAIRKHLDQGRSLSWIADILGADRRSVTECEARLGYVRPPRWRYLGG